MGSMRHNYGYTWARLIILSKIKQWQRMHSGMPSSLPLHHAFPNYTCLFRQCHSCSCLTSFTPQYLGSINQVDIIIFYTVRKLLLGEYYLYFIYSQATLEDTSMSSSRASCCETTFICLFLLLLVLAVTLSPATTPLVIFTSRPWT